MEKQIIILLDRDGTVNKDENYSLGSAKNWKEQLAFLPGVVEGLKLINTIPNSHIFIITNQSGVSLDIYPEFTEERMHEVNKYMIQQLEKEGVSIDGYFTCPFMNNAYVEKSKKRGRTINMKYVIDNHPDLKPNTGMGDKALASLGLKREESILFVVGDRYFDMKFAQNMGAFGIFIKSWKTKEIGDAKKIKQICSYPATDFLDAAKKIQEKVKE